jgi:hypothetical protein
MYYSESWSQSQSAQMMGLRLTDLSSDSELAGGFDWTMANWSYGKNWTRICPTEVKQIGSESWIKLDGMSKSERNRVGIAWNWNQLQGQKMMIGFIGSHWFYFLVCRFEILLKFLPTMSSLQNWSLEWLMSNCRMPSRKQSPTIFPLSLLLAGHCQSRRVIFIQLIHLLATKNKQFFGIIDEERQPRAGKRSQKT